MAKSARQVNFVEGPLLKNIIRFALPLMLSGMLQLFFNAADIIVVGNFANSHEMGAVGSTSSVTNLLTALCIGLSVGANVVVAQRIGAKDRKGIMKSVHAAMCISVVSGIFMGVVGYAFSTAFMRLLDTPAEIIDSAVLYLRIYSIGIPFSIIYNFGSAILRASGDTRRPLFYLSLAGVANVCLNLFFVIILHKGADGVGLATTISQGLAAFLVVSCLLREDGDIRLSLSKLRFYKKESIKILAVGFPAGIQSSLFSVSNMLIQSSINFFGTSAVAGNSAAVSLEGFTYTAMHSLYETTLTLTAQNRGAGNFKRIDKGLIYALGCVATVAFLLGGFIQLFGRVLLGFYTKDVSAIAYGLIRIPFFAIPYFLCGFMENFSGAVRGMGYSVMPLVVALFGTCALRITWVLTIFENHKTLNTLYLSYPITWFITMAMHAVCFLYIRKKHKKMENPMLHKTV